MTYKTIIYLSILGLGLLVLAVGGWVVKGVKAFAGQMRQPSVRPRYA